MTRQEMMAAGTRVWGRMLGKTWLSLRCILEVQQYDCLVVMGEGKKWIKYVSQLASEHQGWARLGEKQVYKGQIRNSVLTMVNPRFPLDIKWTHQDSGL